MIQRKDIVPDDIYNSHIKSGTGGPTLKKYSMDGPVLCTQYRWTCAAKRNALDSHFPVKTSAANGGEGPQGF